MLHYKLLLALAITTISSTYAMDQKDPVPSPAKRQKKELEQTIEQSAPPIFTMTVMHRDPLHPIFDQLDKGKLTLHDLELVQKQTIKALCTKAKEINAENLFITEIMKHEHFEQIGSRICTQLSIWDILNMQETCKAFKKIWWPEQVRYSFSLKTLHNYTKTRDFAQRTPTLIKKMYSDTHPIVAAIQMATKKLNQHANPIEFTIDGEYISASMAPSFDVYGSYCSDISLSVGQLRKAYSLYVKTIFSLICSIEHLISLNLINLQNCFCHDFDELFTSEELPENLRELNLTGDDISSETIEIICNKLPNITILNLSNNNLTTIPDNIANLKNLEELDLSDNNFTEEAIAKIQQLLPETNIIV